jgi:PAS domain S-box-containing protein
MATDFGALLADPLPDAAIVTAAEGTLLHWSEGAEAPFAYSAGEAHGRPLKDLVVPIDHGEDRTRPSPRQ